MKIDAPLSFPENAGLQRVGATGTSPSQNQPAGVGFSPDDVKLSVDGDRIQQLKADLSGSSDVRQERVAALKQAIDQGSYNVSSHQIAQAMASDLMGKGQ
jgi:flagellar biosynthesis anti-sigma factor FlgM